jgi:hypothetical protein
VIQGTWVQAVLLVFYGVLAGLFTHKRMYPFAAYYVGCIVKDAAVFVLAVVKS